MEWYYTLLVFLSVTVVPVAAGVYLAKALRMKDYGWKLGLIFFSLAVAMGVLISSMDFHGSANPRDWNLQIKSGIDLSGGVILIYEIDEEQTRRGGTGPGSKGGATQAPEERIDVSALVQALSRRINPSGVKEVSIRPYGEKQVEIIIPDVGDAEVKQIKKSITDTGFLKFMILATETQHPHLFSLADQPQQATARQVKDENGQVVGEWVLLAKEEGSEDKYKVDVNRNNKVRESRSGQLEVLMAVDPLFPVEGKHLHSTSAGFDETLNPCINFRMTAQGASLFGGLTGSNLPKPNGEQSRLGIVMDGQLLSAPNILSTITDQGRITGRFTQQEVDSIVNVLRAGKLPAVLRKIPISENNISPLLGIDTIRKGKLSIAVSLLAVLVFMLIYYRFAGFVACFALLGNLVLILALMILIGAAFTLPGLAGLVLTVGMSVDANVLIFERIREELRRGAALRMAIRNGFARATTTIVDANVTTLITAIVLYTIGTDQIRGFAVTLILGILASMFTAIFCARVIFEIAERKRWVTRLNMMSALSDSNIDFIGMRKLALAGSLAVILVGLVAVVARGRQLFDIDFNGGSSIQAMFVKMIPIEDVRAKVSGMADDVSVTQLNPEGRDRDTVYQIVTSLPEVDELQAAMMKLFRGPDGKSMLVSHSMSFSNPTSISASDQVPDAPPTEPATKTPEAPTEPSSETPAPPPTPEPPADEPKSIESPADATDPSTDNAQSPARESDPVDTSVEDTAPESNGPEEPADGEAPRADVSKRNDLPADSLLALAGGQQGLLAQATETSEQSAESADIDGDAATQSDDAGEDPRADEDSATEPGDQDAPDAGRQEGIRIDEQATPRRLGPSFLTSSSLEFDEKINAETLEAYIKDAAAKLEISEPEVQLSNNKWDGVGSEGYRQWDLKISTAPETTNSILQHMKAEMDGTPVWLSSSKVGGKVAGDMQNKAVAALVVCLLGIVGYIWIRFQRVVFGLAAVVALVHDVLITLGAIALSLWLSKALGFLMIDEFKISLPIVAAFLTIIGYSLNDTIVVFDRIREVRGKSPNLTADMINTSINQTLSRTLLTSLTTLLVVAILYALGGEGIHGFAFALLVGVVVGTYSSIFVASPFLLWMSGSDKPQNAQKKVAA